MKRFFVIFAMLSLAAGTAVAQDPDFGAYPNEIGIYNTTTPVDTTSTFLVTAGSGFGQAFAYLVISNPVDQDTGLDIATVGGYELTIEAPAGWGLAVTFPNAQVNDFDNAPEHFYVSGLIPTTGLFTVLADVTFSSFGGATDGPIFLKPYHLAPSQTIPGHMAITDGDNNYEPSAAFPISGDYDAPCAGINVTGVVPTEDVSWGSVKSLFQ